MASPLTLPVSYTNVETIYETLPQLKNQATNVTSAEIALQAGQTQAYVNARLARLYDLPFTVDVPVLTEITTDLAIYRLLVKRIFTATNLEDSPWPDRYKEAVEFLDSIVSGETPLLTASLSVLAVTTGRNEPWSSTQDYNPIYFEGGAATDFTVDPDRAEDNFADRST
jgi:phage gp36-like protein